ncbi:DinB family protein [Paenibacillus athensensis]|uniref:DinB-like domain-containing protein n=1 Tax=Paenibacillus athensensis TaxID=1967502 RepID=A0A4Y8Q2F1_9BACL|nr:DinB family protein [Paenibacillus athensensis]MCD1260632.1 DinB family protein [Paenibacillus athensensis]
MLQRPEQDEYVDYFAQYVGKVPEGALTDIMNRQMDELSAMLAGLSEEQANQGYASGKWTVKEVLGHMSDTERVMGYRLLRAARGDRTALPGFDQDVFVQNGAFAAQTAAELLADFRAVRRATLSLFATVSDEAWLRKGVVKDHDMSARALAYVIAGHALHHQLVLQTKYLSGE